MKPVHTAADFYEPRMTVAFVRGMQKLQASIKLMVLADKIAHGQQVFLSEGAVEKALEDVVTVAKNAGMRGVVIGNEAVEQGQP